MAIGPILAARRSGQTGPPSTLRRMGHRSPRRAGSGRSVTPGRPSVCRSRRCRGLTVLFRQATGPSEARPRRPRPSAPDSVDGAASQRRRPAPARGVAADLGVRPRRSARPLLAGVELAVREINDAGGVNGDLRRGGRPRTRAATRPRLFQALRELLEQDQVDVIVGPASSRVALGALDALAAAQRPSTCSPTVGRLDLGQRRDDGFFVRTIGSEALEAVALTRGHDRHRATRCSPFSIPDDDYGMAFANRGAAGLPTAAGGGQPGLLRPDARAVQPSRSTRRLTTERRWSAWWGPGTVGRGRAGGAGRQRRAAERDPDVRDRRSPRATTSARSSIPAGRPPRPASRACHRRPVPVTPWFEAAFAGVRAGHAVAYAAYAYDCVNLLALAAQAAGSDDAEQIQAAADDRQRRAVDPVQGLRRLRRAARRGRNINLDGASGDLDLQDDGDVGCGRVRAVRVRRSRPACDRCHDQRPGRGRLTPRRRHGSASRCGSDAGQQVVQRRDHPGVEGDRTRRRWPRPGRSAWCRRPP